ncbi:Hydroquinone glucosyltransferase [Apostasia shenzhenica]|uniref:Glycosyltransferase n=1 Tax=Apostasia shenzhenica TaxID=1088818 RepID=A0A2I0B718_9ASPA|nr:Hydroquinone glucosyltransferase [Apostasia shenzhenica]
MNEERRPHVAFLPTPGMGHLLPISELAKLLVDRHRFSVTIITFAEFANKTQDTFLAALPSSISSVSLPAVPLSDLPANARIETRISLAAARSVHALRSILLDLQYSTRLVAFVGDLFSAVADDAAKAAGVPYYVFIPTNFLFLALMLELPALDAAMTCEFWQLPEPVRLPGFVPIPGPEILHPLQDRKNDCYKWVVENARRYRQAEGIIVNTFDAIEPEAAKLLAGEEHGRPPVYAVGPLIRSKAISGEEGALCMKWLDAQPPASVVFVCFGSAGTLSREQTHELALGLESSGQRFLWVGRSPSDVSAAESYFTARSSADPLFFLPDGFLDRTKEVGMVVPSWAPQIEVLGHAATGGFLSHCGWNSTLESVAHGVPMISWPLFAEQKMNAVQLVEGVRVALRPAAREDGVHDRKEIARVVRELMEGEEGKVVRRRAKELEAAAAAALGEEGPSSRALATMAERWRSSSPA